MGIPAAPIRGRPHDPTTPTSAHRDRLLEGRPLLRRRPPCQPRRCPKRSTRGGGREKLPLHRDVRLRLERELHAATHIVAALQALPQLGAEHSPDADGYPHGGNNDGPRGADTTSTTERAALTPPDTGTRALADAIDHFLAASKHLAAAHAKLGEYQRPKQVEVGRTSTVGTCPACGNLALPRPRAGYCEACYRAWDRAGRPDRFTFEHERKRREDVA